MPILTITNNTASKSLLANPKDTSYKIELPANTTTVKTVSAEFLEDVATLLDTLRSRFNSDGDPDFTIDIGLDRGLSPNALQSQDAAADVTQWIGNHVGYGLLVAAPGSASVVAAWRVNHAIGEAYVGGKHFAIAAGTNITGDASLDAAGAAFAGPLSDDKDRYASFVLVNNAGTLEKLFIFGAEADAGDAVAVTQQQIAAAVGTYLDTGDLDYNFVELASILFEESSGLTQTNTSIRAVPGSF